MTQYYAVMKTISRWNDAGDEELVTSPVAVLKVDGAWNPTVALRLVAEQLGIDRRQLCAYGVPDFEAPCLPLTEEQITRSAQRFPKPLSC